MIQAGKRPSITVADAHDSWTVEIDLAQGTARV
jgi:hypothetical protein